MQRTEKVALIMKSYLIMRQCCMYTQKTILANMAAQVYEVFTEMDIEFNIIYDCYIK